MNITDDMVERAAKAYDGAFHVAPGTYHDARTAGVRAALTAALGDVEPSLDDLLDSVDPNAQIMSVNLWANGKWGCVLRAHGRQQAEVTGSTRMNAIRAAAANAKGEGR